MGRVEIGKAERRFDSPSTLYCPQSTAFGPLSSDPRPLSSDLRPPTSDLRPRAFSPCVGKVAQPKATGRILGGSEASTGKLGKLKGGAGIPPGCNMWLVWGPVVSLRLPPAISWEASGFAVSDLCPPASDLRPPTSGLQPILAIISTDQQTARSQRGALLLPKRRDQ